MQHILSLAMLYPERGESHSRFSGQGRAMTKNRNIDLIVKITHILIPDSEIRVAHAIDILLAAANPGQDCIARTDESKNRESDSSGNEHEGDCAGAG
jgi:hypothetical protein